MTKPKNWTEITLVTLAVMTVFSLLTLKVKAGDIFDWEEEITGLQIIEQTTLLPLSEPPVPQRVGSMNVIVTAYSSAVDETDDTPFITASGERVRDGIVANNYLPFGSQIRLPELFGDKIFVVKDRMNRRKGDYHVDIWFPSKVEALHFGAENTYLEILQ